MDTFASLGRSPIHTGPTPSLTSHTMLGACIQKFFSSFNFVLGGGRENFDKFLKRMHHFKREPDMTEKYAYCGTVPRTFVQKFDRLSASIGPLNQK